MTEPAYRLLVWYCVIGLLALILFGWDKLMAIRARQRIPEAALLAAALFGGSAGALLGMLLFRHKTRKPLFRTLIPLFLLLQTALLVYTYVK